MEAERKRRKVEGVMEEGMEEARTVEEEEKEEAVEEDTVEGKEDGRALTGEYGGGPGVESEPPSRLVS